MRKILLTGLSILVAIPPIALHAQSGSSTNYRDRVICKRTLTVGSRILRTRTCMTQAQWDQTSREHRQVYEKAIENLRVSILGG